MGKLFFGGVPTAPDVEKLMQAVSAVPGGSIPLQELSEVIAEPMGKSRFRVVVAAWRKRLFREKSIQTKSEGGAIHFLTADQALVDGVQKISHIGRAIGRTHARVAIIDQAQLSSEERRKQRSLMVRETQAMLEQARTSAKQISPPTPSASLRKIV